MKELILLLALATFVVVFVFGAVLAHLNRRPPRSGE